MCLQAVRAAGASRAEDGADEAGDGGPKQQKAGGKNKRWTPARVGRCARALLAHLCDNDAVPLAMRVLTPTSPEWAAIAAEREQLLCRAAEINRARDDIARATCSISATK